MACEAALKDTLLAPSTYHRIGVTETTEVLSLDAYFRLEDEGESVEAFIRQTHDHAVRSVALFEYEAANAYGTPLRLFAKCTYDSLDGDASGAHQLTVRIDGKTSTERLKDAIERRR